VSLLKTGEPEKITDELIGEADKVCACSAIVGDILKATNEADKKKASLKEILDSLRHKEQDGG